LIHSEIDTTRSLISNDELIYFFERLSDEAVIEGLIRDIAESLNEEPFHIFPVQRSTDVAAVRLGREAEVNTVLSDTRDHVSGMLVV
jgi:hypothetical protein